MHETEARTPPASPPPPNTPPPSRHVVRALSGKVALTTGRRLRPCGRPRRAGARCGRPPRGTLGGARSRSPRSEESAVGRCTQVDVGGAGVSVAELCSSLAR
eukprot:scaffold713_cov60-Phaeocystis_antarctica.AAC.1